MKNIPEENGLIESDIHTTFVCSFMVVLVVGWWTGKGDKFDTSYSVQGAAAIDKKRDRNQ